MRTILLLLSIIATFSLMSAGKLKQEVGMVLLALAALILTGSRYALIALHNGAIEFSNIAILFTAIAVPAHILQKSRALDLVGMKVGEKIGYIHLRTKLPVIAILTATMICMVYVLAALFHNTTSILVSSLIIYVTCRSYKLKALPVLAGALVASNLGGFSTRWGDTPNIIESSEWGLRHLDFFKQIVPINVLALAILIVIVTFWGYRANRSSRTKTLDVAMSIVDFRNSCRSIVIDKKLVTLGLVGLSIALIGPFFIAGSELIFSSIAILVCVLFYYKDARENALFALSIETYATFAAIFVLAQVIAFSPIGIGESLKTHLIQSHGSIWAIALTSYIGTLFTEAASWASASAPIIHSINSSHVAAWALGAGIFSGSSSLVTAATAGIILTQETKNFPEDSRITFGSYVVFGLPFSLLMLAFYILMLTLLN